MRISVPWLGTEEARMVWPRLRQHRRLELLRQLPEEVSYFATIVAD